MPGQEPHSIFFYLLLLMMAAGVLQCLGMSFLFFIKKSGDKRANLFYGTLLVTIALTLLDSILVISHFYKFYPAWKFLPIYYTLAFPTLLFYYVKISLYPAYRFRGSDIKHFILPVGQLLFFVVMFFMPVAYKSGMDRQPLNPFFGAAEQFLKLTTFFAYLYFAARYIKHRRKTATQPKEIRQVLYLRMLVQILFVLFCIHTVFVVTDFVSYHLFNIDMLADKLFAGLSALSFAALAFWLGTYGFQVWVWAKRVE